MMERGRIRRVFDEYVSGYNTDDPKIRLKVEHTYRVADLADRIAASAGLDRDLAWLIGILHDIGRFEQVRRYHTFSDAESVDHAVFGADLLFRDGLVERFLPEYRERTGSSGQNGPAAASAASAAMPSGSVSSTSAASVMASGSVSSASAASVTASGSVPSASAVSASVPETDETMAVLEKAIRYHSAYRLPVGLSEKETAYCHVLRDADKIDILRVNCETPFEDIYNIPTDQLKASAVSGEVKQCFRSRTVVLKSLRKTPADYLVGMICLSFELIYPISREILSGQGTLDRLLAFESDNPDTEGGGV